MSAPAPKMTCEEIRHWLSVLQKQHGWSWGALATTLGIGEKKHSHAKVLGNSFIYRSEQIRMSKQLDRILSGELVAKQVRNRCNGLKVVAVLAEHPVPLERSMRMRVDLATGRLGFVPRRSVPPGTMLSFRKGVEAFR